MLFAVELLGPPDKDGNMPVIETVAHEAPSEADAIKTIDQAVAKFTGRNLWGFRLVDVTGRTVHIWKN